MAVLRDRPYPDFNFLVDLGTGNTDGPLAGFEEVILPEIWLDVLEYRNGNEKENNVRKLTGLSHCTNLVLKRGVIGSLDLYQWFNDVRNGNQTALRTVTVQLMSEDHTAVVQTWKVQRARPVRLRWGPLHGRGREPLVEHLELAVERLEME
jgi:phage tail-like protein